METLTIEVVNPQAMNLLEDLEALHLIRMIKKESKPKTKLSKLLRGSISSKVAEEFNLSIEKSRAEWERNI